MSRETETNRNKNKSRKGNQFAPMEIWNIHGCITVCVNSLQNTDNAAIERVFGVNRREENRREERNTSGNAAIDGIE